MATVKRSGPGIAALKTEIANLERKRAEVGFFDTSHYPDGTPVAYIATIQEFGSPQNGIPPRSFMRSTIQEQREAWQQTLAQGAKRVLSGRMTTLQMLESFGLSVVGQIKEKIVEITQPALSTSTIYNRLNRKDKPKNTSTKPLVDTGIMLSSVDSKVSDK